MTRERDTKIITPEVLRSATETVSKGRHFCPVCGDRFETVGAKKRHLRTKHPGSKKGGK